MEENIRLWDRFGGEASDCLVAFLFAKVEVGLFSNKIPKPHFLHFVNTFFENFPSNCGAFGAK